MNERPRIIGYGVCGPNEPYLERTLMEFKRLCDETIICGNNIGERERNLIRQYGITLVEDNREWGKLQWKIKEDFVSHFVKHMRPDLCVCLDMDEVFDKNLTKERLIELYKQPFEAFYFRIINLWDDGYAPVRSFWNIRAWKFLPDLGLSWPHKNLHCGLAPEWTWGRAYYVPFILKHYGLKDKERRLKKAKRYEVYDPDAKFMAKEYYDMLVGEPNILPFDEDELHAEVVKYVIDIKQRYVPRTMNKEEFVYIKIPNGSIELIPKSKLNDYIKRPGHEYVSDYVEIDASVEEIIKDLPQAVIPKESIKEPDVPIEKSKKWSWQK